MDAHGGGVRHSRWLLRAGLIAGIVAAAAGVLVQPGDALPEQAVARVNERLILRDAWLRAVASVASERRTPLTEADRRHILDRLIDEELLVQHGVALGLVEQDRRLRGQLVSDVVAAAAADSAQPEDEAELRRFYAEHRAFFTPPARLRVAAYRVGADGSHEVFTPPVPDVLLPPAKLRSYLGPALTQAALRLQPGERSVPLRLGDRDAFVEVLEHEPGAAPPFEDIADAVRAEYRRRRDEDALRKLLTELRESGAVIARKDLE